MPNDFVHTHIHSMGSLLDGFPSPEEIVERAVELGHDAIAVTDHGSLATSLQFLKAAKKHDIKPIIGMEGYLSEAVERREKGDKIYHMGLLAMNYVGYQNLCRLSNFAWNQGFYKKPRFGLTELKKYSDGLIALSGCMDGIVSWYLRQGQYDDALHFHKWLQQTFEDRYFVEIQPWNPEGLNKDLIELANETGVKIVATADAHYCFDAYHRVLTTDMRWVPAIELSKGQKVLAFDEERIGPTGRRYREAEIEDIYFEEAEVYEVGMSNGDVIAVTADHRWLVCEANGRNWSWKTTMDLVPGKTKTSRIINPTEVDESRRAGWLAGFLDGEGTISKKNRLSFAQNPGPTLSYALECLDFFKIKYTVCDNAVDSDAKRVIIKGRLSDAFEILSRIRPERLISNLNFSRPQIIGNNHDIITIVGVAKATEQKPIAVIKTSTSTLFVEGYQMHNCSQEDILAEEVSLCLSQTTEMKVRERKEINEQFSASRSLTNPMARINFLYPDRKLRFDRINNYIMSKRNLETRMMEAGYDVPEAYSNTLELSAMVDRYDIPTQQNYLPRFLKGVDSDFYLRDLAFDKLADKGFNDNEQYVDRLEEELKVITSLKFSDYILMVWDACNWATSNGILLGPGRGSVGGSLLAYVLGITRIDPIVHDLLFWRFLSMDESGKTTRVDPPDIDTDIEDIRRDEMKEYMKERWKHTASITAVTKFSSKGMVRDISRVFAIPLSEVNAVCKHFNDLEEFLHSEKTQSFRNKYPEIAELSRKFEGRWRFLGVHAAGVVVADRPLDSLLPLESRTAGVRGDARIPVTGFDMDDINDLGLIKMDFLGLSMLTIVNDCLKKIKERHGIDLDLDAWDLDDEAVLHEFTAGHTVGVFQVDTQAYTRLLKSLKVDKFDDLMASNALVRPGPLLTVTPQYIKRKHGVEEMPKENPLMAAITSETYGLVIYQEQLMQALVELGNFTQAEADKVRKIIGKKRDENEFKPFENKWVENAGKELGVTKAKKLWKDFLKFAGYAFNKAHACEYSVLSYQTMWLKKYYTTEFMYALLKNEKDKDRITTFMFEAKRLGVEVRLPNINTSEKYFSITDDGAIQFGLSNVAAVGEKAADEIVAKRPFDTLDDFEKRVNRRSCNSTAIQNLIAVGALKEIYDTKLDYASHYYELLGLAQDIAEQKPPVPVVSLEDRNDKELSTIMVLVKAVVSKPDWTRIEVEDATEAGAFFNKGGFEIEEGKIVIALVYEQDWVSYIPLSEFDTSTHPMKKFLTEEIFGEEDVLREHGFGTLETDKCLILPVYVRIFKVRNGRMLGRSMAHMVVTDGRDTKKVVVFPDSYANCAAWLEAFVPIVIKKQLTKSGDITVEENGVKLARKLMEEKGL